MQGKVALVTGAGTGIGRGVALALAARGVHVAINYHSSEEGARTTLEQVQAQGVRGLLVRADVSVAKQVRDMVDEVLQTFGRLDILVNNSAAQLNLGLADYDEAGYDRVMGVNLRGYFLCTQAAIAPMKRQGGGRIVYISSVHGKRPTDFDVVYAITKGGIKMLARESAIELGKYGITVNVIEPGAVHVGEKSGKPRPIVPAQAVSNESRRRGLRKFPLGRVGTPADIGHIVCFLADDASEFITGAAIRADGGSMLL
ncbi:MAG: SDR family oxidoreductase [Firmicutes bacterium]|nr:SDR family oxidoreductase [Bacillota bacterium]